MLKKFFCLAVVSFSLTNCNKENTSELTNENSFIEEVERSKLLITDTFHGVVMALMTNTPFVLIRSDIVMSRLNGPILDCFHSSRICEPSQLIGALNKVDIYDDHDLQNGKLEEFIDSSRKHISSKLLSMKESKYRKC